MPFDCETPDKLEYNFYPVKTKSLIIKVKAAHDAHIALTTGPFDGNPMYEIFIGGWGNAKTALRRNKEKPDAVLTDTPNILSSDAVKEFILSWEENRVVLHKSDESKSIIEFNESSPFEITHFGIRTGWGASGSWIIDEEAGSMKLNQSGTSDYKGSGPWRWVPASGGTIPPNSFKGGFDNEDLFVGRAEWLNAIVPGKVLASHGVCYIAWGGEEHSVDEFEVLCDCEADWVPSSDGEIPPKAIPGGSTEEGETLYIGRARHGDTMTIGKIHCSHKCCYIPFGGEEISYPEYEVLVEK